MAPNNLTSHVIIKDLIFILDTNDRIAYFAELEDMMPYNEGIDARIEEIVIDWPSIDKKKMFGGICYLLNGNMFCGVYKDYLILRLGENGAADLLKENFARPFDITGKAMKGWAMVSEEGFEEDTELGALLEQARDFAGNLPPK